MPTKRVTRQEVAEAEKKYYDSRAFINELDGKSARVIELVEILYVNQLNSINEKFNELKLSLTSMKERLSVEFNIDINQILNEEFEMVQPLEEVQEVD
jgi:chromosome segregation protein